MDDIFFTLIPSYMDKVHCCSAGLVHYLLLQYTYMTCIYIYIRNIVQGCKEIPYHIKWQSHQHFMCFNYFQSNS